MNKHLPAILVLFFIVNFSVNLSTFAATGTKVENIRLDTSTPGAKIEFIWLLDASRNSQFLYSLLQQNLATFHTKMHTAQIEHSSILLSADPYWFQGKPILDNAKNPLLNSNHTQWPENLKERMKNAWGFGQTSSTLWSLLLFATSANSISSFLEKGVPVEVLALNQNHDWIQSYWEGSPYKDMNAATIAKTLKSKFDPFEKKFRLHAVQPKYPKPDPWPRFRPPQFWDTVLPATAEASGGNYYDCSTRFKMETVLGDLAAESILRANVYAKKLIKLKENPLDPTKITLRLREKTLEQNIQWQYLSSENSILLNWSQIEIVVRPGDRLVISYPI